MNKVSRNFVKSLNFKLSHFKELISNLFHKVLKTRYNQHNKALLKTVHVLFLPGRAVDPVAGESFNLRFVDPGAVPLRHLSRTVLDAYQPTRPVAATAASVRTLGQSVHQVFVHCEITTTVFSTYNCVIRVTSNR